MYKTKPCHSCEMPKKAPVEVLVLNASLIGQPPSQDREKRLKNNACKHMAKNVARNLLYYAQLLKMHPLVPQAH
ncbi:MAG: hypothetical protein ACRD3A_02945 [Terriglobales bacterium]